MKTIDQLREELALQIIELALASDNEQFKLDSYRATAERGKPKPTTPEQQPGGMTIFRQRVKQAETKNGAVDEAEADC